MPDLSSTVPKPRTGLRICCCVFRLQFKSHEPDFIKFLCAFRLEFKNHEPDLICFAVHFVDSSKNHEPDFIYSAVHFAHSSKTMNRISCIGLCIPSTVPKPRTGLHIFGCPSPRDTCFVDASKTTDRTSYLFGAPAETRFQTHSCIVASSEI